MKLYIDTSDREKIVVGLDEARFETDAKEGSSQKLLPFIEEVLKKKGKKIEDVSEIEVATGPGSFTGLRVGVSVANTLGWSLSVPVNGKNIQKDGPIEIKYEIWLQEVLGVYQGYLPPGVQEIVWVEILNY